MTRIGQAIVPFLGCVSGDSSASRRGRRRRQAGAFGIFEVEVVKPARIIAQIPLAIPGATIVEVDGVEPARVFA